MGPFLLSMMTGVVAVIVLVVLIMAIRLSYAIERITNPRPEGALPRYTNLFSTVAGRGVSADDDQTMQKVKKLRALVAIIAVLMLANVLLSVALR